MHEGFLRSTVDYPDPDSFGPKNRGKEPKNPLMLNEAGLTKPTPTPGCACGPDHSGSQVVGWEIGTIGMPLTTSGRERPPHSDAYRHAPRSWE